MWCQKACLIKTLSIRSSCTAEDNCGRKSVIFLPPLYHPQHMSTHTNTGLTILPFPFLFLISSYFFHSFLLTRYHPLASILHAPNSLFSHQEDEPQNCCIQLSHHVLKVFSGFCAHQHSVATVTPCQRFLLNPH